MTFDDICIKKLQTKMSNYRSYHDAPKDRDGRPLYGMDLDLAKKHEEKHDLKKEQEVLHWIQAVTGERFQTDGMRDELKDGQVLCKLINKIKPGTIKKINSGSLQYLCMENLHVFLQACQSLGLPARETFAEADLYEGKNIPWVTESLYSFAQLVQSMPYYKGPKLGVKVSPRNRSFPPKPVSTNATKSSGNGSQYDELLKLGELRDKGILTEEEFALKKKQLLRL